MEYEIGALERREGQQSVRCRKTSARGAKVTEILGMGCSTRRLACSESIQRVDLTGVLRVLALVPCDVDHHVFWI
jgi:hypothetical protein